MVAIKALTVLALAGAITAVPVAQPVGEALVRREPWDGRPHYSWSWRWGGQGSKPQSEPAASTPTAQAAAPAAPAAPAAAAQPTDTTSSDASSNAGSSAPASTPAASSGSNDGSYMSIVNQWRSNMGMSALAQDSQLQSNAQNAADSTGGQLIHKLNPGSMAQVMAPGNTGNFESVFVGGWLCEMPSLPGLGSGVCNSASQGWDHAGQTGHAKILSSTSYSKIGCALGDGIWSCDLA